MTEDGGDGGGGDRETVSRLIYRGYESDMKMITK